MTKILNTLAVALICCTAVAFCAHAQETKINFQDITWEQAMKKAEKEKKFIFVDAYRNPCESCDQAIAEVFSIDSIATLYNDNFVSIRIDMTSDAGSAFAPKLQMLMYPAYIFFSADGEQLGSSNAYNFVQDHGQAMYQANLAITQGHIRLNNSRHIQFVEMPWAAVLEKSKKENKPIFIDTYTTWCRPCIQMDRNVFTLDEVADFYNENFINVKMNAEKGEGLDIQEKFNVRAYPTYLYLDGNGELVKETGGYTEAEKFIEYGKQALKEYQKRQAEGKGIKFIEGSWKDILKKSRAENKLIFFDAYTTWCGPCKMMAKNVFTNDTIANFFNENFINTKFDMEKGEGIDLKEKFGIRAYPTYIYVDGEGNEVHRTVGSTEVQKFLGYAKDALSDDKNLAYLEAQYKAGNRETSFITKYLSALNVAYKSTEMNSVAAKYLDGLKRKKLLEPTNWDILNEYLTDDQSKSFVYLVKNRDKFYKKYDKKKIDDKIYVTYIRGGKRYVTTHEDGKKAFDEEGFKKYLKGIEGSGVDRKDKIVAYAKINNFYARQAWEKYAMAVDRGLANGNVDKTPMSLYNYALTMKHYAKTPELLTKGAQWAKMGGDLDTIGYAATYYNLEAELLDKAGKPEEAEDARNRFNAQQLQEAKDKNPMKELVPMSKKKDK